MLLAKVRAPACWAGREEWEWFRREKEGVNRVNLHSRWGGEGIRWTQFDAGIFLGGELWGGPVWCSGESWRAVKMKF